MTVRPQATLPAQSGATRPSARGSSSDGARLLLEAQLGVLVQASWNAPSRFIAVIHCWFLPLLRYLRKGRSCHASIAIASCAARRAPSPLHLRSLVARTLQHGW